MRLHSHMLWMMTLMTLNERKPNAGAQQRLQQEKARWG